MSSKKLQSIEGIDGLQATYGGGDYTVTVWAVESTWERDDGYELVFCRSNTYIAHERQFVTPDDLETEMRKWEPDLRKWRKVEYEV